jgi:hypothetical protein
MPFRLSLKRGREVSKGLPSWEYTFQPWSSPREEGLCYKWDESRNPAASLTDQTLWRRVAKSCAHPAAHRVPSWRVSRVLEEKSSRASLATGPRPRRKLLDDLKRLDTPTSPRRGPSSFTSLAQATMTTLRTATWMDTMRRKCGLRSYSRSGPKSEHS